MLKKILKNRTRTRTRTTKWNIFFNYSTIIYGFITGIVLVPLYLKFIPTLTYGYWLATGNILTWLTVIDPGFSAVLQQKVAFNYGANNNKEVGEYALSGIIINLCFVLIITIIGFVLSMNFTNWLSIKDYSTAITLEKAFNLTLMGTLLMIFSFILIAINQGIQSSLSIGIIYTVANFTGITVTILLLYKGFGVVSLGYSLLSRSAITVVGNIIYLSIRFKIEDLKFSFNSKSLKDFTSLSGYNFLGKIGSTLNTQVNAFISAKILSPFDTTILKFSQSVPDTSKLFITRPALAIMPSITHLAGEGNQVKIQEVLVKYLNYLIWSSGIALAGFILFNKTFITLWVGKNYYGGTLLNSLIVTLLFITLYTYSFSSIVYALGNIKKNSIVQFTQSIIYIPLVILGAKLWGLKGMLIAAIIAELSIAGWYYPKTFFSKIKLTKPSIRIIIYEFIKVLSISLLIIFIFKSKAQNWYIFICEILAISCIYIFLLSIISKAFRKELIFIFQKIRCKLKIK